jgi:hypothetical protein
MTAPLKPGDVLPFTGFQLDTPWPAPRDLGPKDVKALDKGRRLFLVFARVEPHRLSEDPARALADLLEFGQAIVDRLPGRIAVGRPKPGDRSIGLYFDLIARDPMRAISACALRADRAIKKTGKPVVRISWDTRDVTGEAMRRQVGTS